MSIITQIIAKIANFIKHLGTHFKRTKVRSPADKAVELFGVEPAVIVCVEMIDEHSGLVVREVFVEQLDQGGLQRLHSTGLSKRNGAKFSNNCFM